MTNTEVLANFLAGLTFADIPEQVVTKTESLCLDWLGSVFASTRLHPTHLFEEFATRMGPDSGNSRILVSGDTTSAYFAAMVNGASAHLVEQDDLHNGAVFHPAAVIFPAALAVAQDLNRSGQEFILAVVTAYEAGIRIGEFLGRSHYRVFHTTATVGALAAAVAVGKLLRFDATNFAQVLGNAGTQAAGLWAFLEDGADSKPLHAAKANANGVLAGYMTAMGLVGTANVLESAQGMAAGMSSDANPERLIDRLGGRWALMETSFKYHASCRHTHPAADALLLLMQRYQLNHQDIVSIEAYVHQAALDVLGSVAIPTSIHQAKFSMGTVLALIAVHGSAGLSEFELFALTDPAVVIVRDKVTMIYDADIDASYPSNWRGKVMVTTKDGRALWEMINFPKGDPENSLSQGELEDKFRSLLGYSKRFIPEQIEALIVEVEQLRYQPTMRYAFLS